MADANPITTDVEKFEGESYCKQCPPSLIQFGDEGYDELDLTETEEEVTLDDFFSICYEHSKKEWFQVAIYMFFVCFILFCFIFSLRGMSVCAKNQTDYEAINLIGNANPAAALVVGMLATILLQSSSTTTSIIVSLVSAASIGTEPAIYMVMGANLGSMITNKFAALV